MKKTFLLLLLSTLVFLTNCEKEDDKTPEKVDCNCNDDLDKDGVKNSEDLDPKDPNVCRDLDKDGCDDCRNTGADQSGGDQNNDGDDTDGDGICDTTDKDIDNDGVENDKDTDPKNPNVCRDADNDGCDDCRNTGADQSGGDPNNDGEDIDNDGICDENDTDIDDTLLQGSITSDKTLDATKAYTLVKPLLIENGATLTIPAGTVITARQGLNFIAVTMGSKIDIQGTADKPVVMQGQGNGGDWGGLLLCGRAITTKGANAYSEVGGLIYGGTNSADNSGSINYLIIKDAGANINPDSQFNGLSLYAIGSKTSISNVAVISGLDDGIEFFGGSVNVTNYYAKNNSDDQIDWTEGWNGTIDNSYISVTGDFSTIVEGDGINNNPKIKNLYAVSIDKSGTALQFRKESGAIITNISLVDFTTLVEMRDGFPLSNVQIDGADATLTGPYNSTVDNSDDFAWVK